MGRAAGGGASISFHLKRFKPLGLHVNVGEGLNQKTAMDSITLKNFRCVRDEQSARLAPLTLLVGDNSTGKTSFMAMIRVLWDMAYNLKDPNFKNEPYDLGSFDDIAHHRGRRGGRALTFEAGFQSILHRNIPNRARNPLCGEGQSGIQLCSSDTAPHPFHPVGVWRVAIPGSKSASAKASFTNFAWVPPEAHGELWMLPNHRC